jgi:hypothetical protein
MPLHGSAHSRANHPTKKVVDGFWGKAMDPLKLGNRPIFLTDRGLYVLVVRTGNHDKTL